MKTSKPLFGKRIAICGKGGSGKSTLVTLLTHSLHKSGYHVLVLDGDASNPSGLSNLMFGSKKGPKPLLDFFGGRNKVTCPVDDPSPLTRMNEYIPVSEKPLDIDEIPSEYIMQRDGIVLFQAGKTQRVFEGCDGPMSKIVRDCIISGDYVMIIDLEAGIEHFGRGIEKNIDIIIVAVDPTYESILIATAANKLCRELDIKYCWAILNKIESDEIKIRLSSEAQKGGVKILGTVRSDPEVFNAALYRKPLGVCEAERDVSMLLENLEQALQ